MIRSLIAALLLLAAAAHAAPVMVVDSQPEYWLPMSDGWLNLSPTQTVAVDYTPFPATDTRIIYVSSSIGNDANNGLYPTDEGGGDGPVATLAQATALGRNALYYWQQDGYYSGINPEDCTYYEDWILLKRGDTWAESPSVRRGPTPARPCVWGAYGTGARPVIASITKGSHTNRVLSNVAVVGIETDGISVVNTAYETNNWNKAAHWWFEDVVAKYILFYSTDSIMIRRCVVADNYAIAPTHAQGSYMDGVSGLWIEESIYDHGGWHDSIEGAEPTIFNHNLYIAANCSNVTLRRSIITRASSHGIQLRCGGTVEDNLFVDNPIGVLLGGGVPPDSTGGITGTISGNVILDCGDINGSDLAGYGIEVQNCNSATVSNNIVAGGDGSSTRALRLKANDDSLGYVGCNNVSISNLSVYQEGEMVWVDGDLLDSCTISDSEFYAVAAVGSPATASFIAQLNTTVGASTLLWTGNRYNSADAYSSGVYKHYTTSLQSLNRAEWLALTGESDTAISWTAPDRDVGTYMASIGETATLEAFITAARGQSQSNWQTKYTAAPVIAHVQGGFSE